MPGSVDALNSMPAADLEDLLSRCCGARRWAQGMAAARPFANWDDLTAAADRIWAQLDAGDWKEAFAHHPMIGDLESLRAKFAGTAEWAQGEQGQVREAEEKVLRGLAEGNQAYLARFGYIFIVCATGKSASEMLTLLQARLPNDPDRELVIAAEQQRQITRIRLEKAREELEAGS